MKLHYAPDTDSLYIELRDSTSVESEEIEPDVVLDFDAVGNVIGVDIDHASRLVNLSRMEEDSHALIARIFEKRAGV